MHCIEPRLLSFILYISYCPKYKMRSNTVGRISVLNTLYTVLNTQYFILNTQYSVLFTHFVIPSRFRRASTVGFLPRNSM